MPFDAYFQYLAAYLFIVFYMTCFSFISMENYKSVKEAVVVNSFPVKRKDLVVLEYLMLIVYNVIFAFVAILETNILKLVGVKGGEVATLEILIMSLLISLIYFSIYIPFSIKNFGKTNRINVFMYVFMFCLPQILKKFVGTKIGQKFIMVIGGISNPHIVILGILVLGILMFMMSFFTSVKIYENIDF
jgi:ABC-2 type transport system permease protein